MEKYGDELFKGANPKLFEFSRALRKTQTDAEELIWQSLRNRKILGFKFRRQHQLDKYIADFYCHEAKLIIEIDGEIHLRIENQEYDKYRTLELENLGLQVIRFTNEMVFNEFDKVLSAIKVCLQKSLTP